MKMSNACCVLAAGKWDALAPADNEVDAIYGALVLHSGAGARCRHRHLAGPSTS